MLGFLAIMGVVLLFSWVLCHTADYLSKLPYWERCSLVVTVTLSYTLFVSIIVREIIT